MLHFFRGGKGEGDTWGYILGLRSISPKKNLTHPRKNRNICNICNMASKE